MLDPASVDVLSDALRTLRLTGALFFPVEASSPWVNEIPASHQLGPLVLPGAQHVVSYHIVTRGECWISLPQAAPARLEAGDIVVIPHGDPYVMSSAPQAPPDAPRDSVLEFFRQMATGSVPAVIVDGGGGPERAKLVCGFLACDVRPFNPILETLPRLLLLRPPPPASDRLGRLVEFALEESLQNRPGARCVLLRLSEVLFVEVVRRHLEGLPSDQSGWLAGLRDPVVGHALALLHARPARSWTLERLAPRDRGLALHPRGSLHAAAGAAADAVPGALAHAARGDRDRRGDHQPRGGGPRRGLRLGGCVQPFLQEDRRGVARFLATPPGARLARAPQSPSRLIQR